MAASSRIEAAAQLVDVYKRIAELHHERFPAAAHPRPPEQPLVDEAEVVARHRTENLQGVSIFARRRRREAVAVATEAARVEVDARKKERARRYAAEETELDIWWRELQANDPDTVMSSLASAFEDNDAAAAPLGVTGTEATVVVIVPTLASMPQKKPDVTPTGRATIRAMPKKELAVWHAIAVAGCILVTVKEAVAVAPGLVSVRIVAVTTPERDAYGARKSDVLVAARIERRRLEGVQWATVDSVRILNDISTELQLKQIGVAKTLTPLTLDDEPELQLLLGAIDYEELGA